jgi:hypothetical protein
MTSFAETGRPPAHTTGTAVVLPEVLLPMWWWRGIPVRRSVPVTMTALERFALELALTMGRAEPDEFFEITGLPGTLLGVVTRRLVSSGVLTPADGGFAPLRPAADRAARSLTLQQEQQATLDIVLLPRTGDMIALDPRTSWLRAADRLRPQSVGGAPASAQVRGRTLASYLSERLRAGTVAGAGPDITAVALMDAESPRIDNNGWCPVYRCAGAVRIDGDQHVPVATLPGANGKDPVEATLPGASKLADRWLAAADVVGEPAMRAQAWNTIMGHRQHHAAPRAERLGPGRWRLHIRGDDAGRLAARHYNLVSALGLEVREEDLVAEVCIELAAGDAAAAELIDLDRLLTDAAEPGAGTGVVPRTVTVRERAWQLGFHSLVYTLRETEDFSYG